ncbi:hypothetical protein E5D57_009834 [Metarhizium anisopliae]|nr:hypothetical protein E5D57_009834 [Metarhizium anisopliae]
MGKTGKSRFKSCTFSANLREGQDKRIPRGSVNIQREPESDRAMERHRDAASERERDCTAVVHHNVGDPHVC